VENYFNYFTEIEECYQKCRGTRTLLSPLDWALIESWKDAGLPLEAVLIGIARAFEKYKARQRKYRTVNALAYCTQEVMRAAEEAQAGQAQSVPRKDSPPPFTADEIVRFLGGCAQSVEAASRKARQEGQQVLADDLAAMEPELLALAAEDPAKLLSDLEELEIRLTALEEKMAASLIRAASVERMAGIQEQVERGLGPYRRKMTGPQIESLERQFRKRCLMEHYEIPRLSLFYM
jgi:acyl transferase domain-containing protein